MLVHGEDGLKSAEKAAKALYEGGVTVLGQMQISEILNLFEGASVVEILSEPGFNMLKLAIKARCFPTESEL